jgi:PKHD-type hydroxylase
MNHCFFDLETLGAERKFCDYYHCPTLFNIQETEEIKKIGDSLITKSAKIGGKDKNNIRRGEVSWLPRTSEHLWVYNRLFKAIKKANDSLWKFELNGFFEDCQYTTYKESLEGGDKYDFHLDFDGTSGIHRKISAVLQLTDESEYEGGNLELFPRTKPIIAPKKVGSITIFPSFMLHRVTEVTKGKRNSLVVWVSGYPFK